jgi:hypothetical protein
MDTITKISDALDAIAEQERLEQEVEAERKAEERRVGFAELLDILRRGDAPKSTDEERLRQLMKSLDITISQLRDFNSTVAEVERSSTLYRNRETAYAEFAEAVAAVEKFDTEAKARLQELKRISNAAGQRHSEATRARKTITDRINAPPFRELFSGWELEDVRQSSAPLTPPQTPAESETEE